MHRYQNSEKFLKRAESVIPLGSQTFSKSKLLFPPGISPLFLESGKGSYVWDIDGNRYIDLVNGLASVILGYKDRGIERAVIKQLKKGVSLSLPGRVEAELAEALVSLIPSAEMARFSKNGSDATTAAIRLARAYTGRDHVLVCGYHGWQDWYIGTTTRNKGVPDSISSLTHPFEFNNLPSLKKKLDELESNVAAVILEPMNIAYPEPNFLENVKMMTHKSGALLIFDETITGFRFSQGGAQELFGVYPDLSTFGKGMANGFPLSAIVGKREIMMEFENIFFSGTFGGELLSLVAALEVCKRFQKYPIPRQLAETGDKLISKIIELESYKSLDGLIKFTGHPSWKFINFENYQNYSSSQIKTLFMQVMFENGVLLTSTHNVSLALKNSDIDKILKAYDTALITISTALSDENLEQVLKVPPINPIFKIR